jgi:hypothetical protein
LELREFQTREKSIRVDKTIFMSVPKKQQILPTPENASPPPNTLPETPAKQPSTIGGKIRFAWMSGEDEGTYLGWTDKQKKTT